MDDFDTSNDKSVLEELDIEKPLPSIQTLQELADNPPPAPKVLIEGLLHRGSKMMLASNSKAMKSFNLLNLALSVAAGCDWMGFQATQGKVLYINLELQSWSIPQRMAAIVAKRQASVNLKGSLSNMSFWNLRGHSCDIAALRPKLEEQLQTGYDLIIVDPIYKLMGARDENSAGDIGELLNELERFAIKADAAVVFAHHFAKGNAAAKDAIDRSSGSGVWGRDPDCIISMTQHEEEECFAVEAIVRHFPRPAPFVVRWIYPVFLKDTDADASKLRGAGGRPTTFSKEEKRNAIRDVFSRKQDSYQDGFNGLVKLTWSQVYHGIRKGLKTPDGAPCSESTAKNLIKAESEDGILNKTGDYYTISQVNDA